MQIVEMTANDCKELAELDKRCFAVPWSEKSFLEETENKLATYYLAKVDDKIVGYCGFWKVGDEGQITNIAVLPEYRRNGIAKKLLEKVISQCTNMQIVLEVREGNVAAITLYEQFGFKKEGMRKNFYRSPVENAIVMIRREN